MHGLITVDRPRIRASRSAPALVVLQTYLRALVAGDGETAHALATSTFVLGNGELCGADGIRVTSWEILNPYSNDADFAVNLTIDGGNEVMHPEISPGSTRS